VVQIQAKPAVNASGCLLVVADSDESLEKLLWKEMQKRGISNIGERLPPPQ